MIRSCRNLRALRGAIALAVVAAIASAPTATAGATPKKVFTSKRYGYSLVLPRTWSMKQTRGTWPTGAQPQQGTAGVDAFWYRARTLVVAARSVAPGATLDAWAQEVASITPAQCSTDASVPASLGGEPAHRWAIHCPDGANVIKIAALHGGRGYLFVLLSFTKLNRADRTFFANVVRRFKFAR